MRRDPRLCARCRVAPARAQTCPALREILLAPKPPLGARSVKGSGSDRRRLGKLATLASVVDAAKRVQIGLCSIRTKRGPAKWAGPHRIGRYV
jgi:hypothetical protein